MRYSVKNDSIFRADFLCFGKNNADSPFVKKGFKTWKKASGVKENALDRHMHSREHQMAEEKARNWLLNCTPGKGIISIIDTIMALGQRGVALRGNWNVHEKEEDGNFNFFVNWKAKTDDDLAQHLKYAHGNGRYMSPQIQNEIISFM